AVRTQETWKFSAREFGVPVAADTEERLYDATPEAILDLVKETPANVQSLLVIAHNPGLQDLALMLLASGNVKARGQLEENLPTAGLVIVDFPFDEWRNLRRESGSLERFVTPKLLRAGKGRGLNRPSLMPVSRRQSRTGGFTMTIGQGNFLGTLRDRYSDPLLTVLTVLLVFEMFVVAPLQASGIEIFQALGVFAAVAMLSGVLILSGSPIALLALFAAISMNVLVIVLRLRGTPTAFDLPLVAAAWLILSITLGAVVGRAVFAPGAINYHRIVGAVLLYLLITLAFVALFVFVGFLIPKAF